MSESLPLGLRAEANALAEDAHRLAVAMLVMARASDSQPPRAVFDMLFTAAQAMHALTGRALAFGAAVERCFTEGAVQ